VISGDLVSFEKGFVTQKCDRKGNLGVRCRIWFELVNLAFLAISGI